ncbi:creatininase family protein [Thermodesulfobacteriota bacterium]
MTDKKIQENKFPDGSGDDPLAVLEVFERLEVGPVKVEPRRLMAPYRLYRNGQEHRTELIYTYEEPVFGISDPESANLAAMISAQVAINYGLFCRSIVFHGVFDETDRRLIREMTENTSREILVKKFWQPNPFLTMDFKNLPVVKKPKYTRARLEFPESSGGRIKPQWQRWSMDRSRHCILSSGGKDSLLSFGLVNEIGYEAHPLFVNESGRHWFTALNAYRYFKENISHTGRVWTNSDRVFTWMLTHMPFIRKNFADIRADEYPIRLWTVAVFLFGVLPLMRKRGIGRLIIGDEYDTTVPASFSGIQHYDGLYDQSLFFDNALSRYFLRKGWAVSQFSILRPLSELLIEKILIERYPDLQIHQTSCHMTHKAGERVAPCGNCEKCRRIVGMLSALGADARSCGYTADQIENCLKRLQEKGIHQEEAGIHQLMNILSQKGLIEHTDRWHTHPEVMKLRFDSGCSPINAIPKDLREPLYTIYLEHAQGAVRRIRMKWKSFNLLNHPDLSKHYAFEIDNDDNVSVVQDESDGRTATEYLWGELTWPDAKERLQVVDIALLPVGAVEQHGPHLPLDTDAFDADYLARRVAEACSNPKPLTLPLIAYGVSYHHDDFPGTISISNDTLSRLVYEIGIGAARNGIQKLVVINAHGGNTPALNHAAQMINRDARIFVCVDSGETSDVDITTLAETPNDVHAGEIETSTCLAVRPHLVKMEAAVPAIPEFSSRYLNFTSKRSVTWYGYTRRISATGVMGDPTKASAQKGSKIWEIMIAHLVALVEDLKRLTLDEIHHRKL